MVYFAFTTSRQMTSPAATIVPVATTPVPPASASMSCSGTGCWLGLSAGTVFSALSLVALCLPFGVVRCIRTDLADLGFEVLGSGCPERRKLPTEGDEVSHSWENANLSNELQARHLAVVGKEPRKGMKISDYAH